MVWLEDIIARAWTFSLKRSSTWSDPNGGQWTGAYEGSTKTTDGSSESSDKFTWSYKYEGDYNTSLSVQQILKPGGTTYQVDLSQTTGCFTAVVGGTTDSGGAVYARGAIKQEIGLGTITGSAGLTQNLMPQGWKYDVKGQLDLTLLSKTSFIDKFAVVVWGQHSYGYSDLTGGDSDDKVGGGLSLSLFGFVKVNIGTTWNLGSDQAESIPFGVTFGNSE